MTRGAPGIKALSSTHSECCIPLHLRDWRMWGLVQGMQESMACIIYNHKCQEEGVGVEGGGKIQLV